MRDPIAREFLLAFWKVHILYHAADGRGVYGQWMLEELHRHGYRLSPGTLYPILARMAKRGWLRAAEPTRSKGARVYRLTPRGHDVLHRLRQALDELHGEVAEHHVAAVSAATARRPLPKRPRARSPSGGARE